MEYIGYSVKVIVMIKGHEFYFAVVILYYVTLQNSTFASTY